MVAPKVVTRVARMAEYSAVKKGDMKAVLRAEKKVVTMVVRTAARMAD